ncbi:CvpA family protein [Alphaproteobacteria bacterium]|nr:CvpA family protein [Alphaproteobacteria bacterium]
MIEFTKIIDEFQAIDYLIIILSILIILFSTWKGFIQSLLGVLSWIGAVLISINFHSFLGDIILDQVSKLEFITRLNLPLDNISKYLIAIPITFILSFYLLKKFKKFITSDLDKGIFGNLIDKFFGIIFGIIFSYIILTTILISNSIIDNNWYEKNIVLKLKDSSTILIKINEINQNYIQRNSDIIEEM